jgi:hypothetical protein
MKKLLLLLAVGIFGISQANAQCTPDPQYTAPGIYPDSATGMDPGCVGVLYDQLITVVVPVDTTVEIIPGFPTTLDFDSIVLVSFTGLPASGNLSYVCWSTLGTNCSFPGGGTGCMSISGTPTVADIGVHNLVITVDVYVGGAGSPATQEVIDWYSIEITDCPAGLDEKNNTALGLFPNPADQEIQLNNAHGEDVIITDINGQVMKVVAANGNGAMKIDVSALTSGVYFVQVGNETTRFVKK